MRWSASMVIVMLGAGCRQLVGIDDPIVIGGDAAIADTPMGEAGTDADPDAAMDAMIDAPPIDAPPPNFVCSPNSALRLCLAFDGNGNDDSQFDNNASVQNAPFVTGFRGSGILTGTSSSVIVPYDASFNVTRVTVKAMVNPSSFPTGGDRMIIFDGNGYRVGLYPGGALRCSMGTTAGLQEILSGPGVIALGAWTRVACIYDQVSLRAYTNGTLAASFAHTQAIVTNTESLAIGHIEPSGDPFLGVIDELEFWDAIVAP